MSNGFLYFIGIDVSKDKVDIFSTETSSHFTVKNTKKAIRHALYHGFDKDNTLVILENTGGYEKVCIETLINIGFKVHRANNNKVKHFISFNGIKAKTDKIDAESLALFGETVQNNPKLKYKLTIYEPLTDTQETLRQSAYFTQNLKRIRASLKNMLKSPGCSHVHDHIKSIIDFLNDEIKVVECEEEALVKSDSEINDKYELLKKYRGVGKTTAMELIAFLPELGKLRKQHIVSLSGLAPRVRESGTIKGYRSTKGDGRPLVKRILFMAALSGTRYNKDLCDYYTRKLNEGKRKMVAMTACMRKMVVQLNAITARGEMLF